MTRLLHALALLCACPSTAIHSTVVPGLWLQREYTQNTKQICQHAPELLACAERMSVLLLERARVHGYTGSWGRPALCLVESQEPCCVGDVCAVSSSPAASKLPRAGCTWYNATWIARRSADGLPYDYSATLEAELRTSIGTMLLIPTTPRHDSPWDLEPSTGVACNWRR